MKEAVIAIDLGGTYVRTALVTGDGEIVARHEGATEPARGPADLVRRIAAAAGRLVEDVAGAEIYAVCGRQAALPGGEWS